MTQARVQAFRKSLSGQDADPLPDRPDDGGPVVQSPKPPSEPSAEPRVATSSRPKDEAEELDALVPYAPVAATVTSAHDDADVSADGVPAVIGSKAGLRVRISEAGSGRLGWFTLPLSGDVSVMFDEEYEVTVMAFSDVEVIGATPLPE
ncbi:hypothetical protein BTE77_34850 [Ensifer adhaerens]|nr:hypothetical protein BTE77_34850 [Ensifer adhaerens]